jgi:transposase InsO family protein
MDDKNSDEILSRRRAIRLMMKGRRPCEILKLIPRSRVWLYKWQRRYEELGWAGLENYSRRPHRSPQEYKADTRALVLNLRRRLARSSVGLVGARALRHEILKRRLLRTVPCEATIKLWVKDAGLTTSVPPAPEKSYYPVPHFAPETVWHLMDWTARYIEGGQKVFAFHTVEAQTRGLTETIRPSKTVASVIAHGVEVWQQLGVPDFLQLDNDSAFTGGEKTARRFGAFVRLCLYLGIELIFIPPAEPKRNSLVESVHGLWATSFWDRNHFRSFAQVLRQGRKFPEWYNHHYCPPALAGLTPAQAQQKAKRQRLTKAQARGLPQHLPVTAGRVHFIRRVAPAGEIRFLGETWRVGKRLIGQYVWATVVTHAHRLEIYHRGAERGTPHLVKTFDYEIAEPVHKLWPEFRRHRQRPSLLKIL